MPVRNGCIPVKKALRPAVDSRVLREPCGGSAAAGLVTDGHVLQYEGQGHGAGDIPVGAYQSNRLANIGIGHGTVDAGVGYTYFDQPAGREFSAVLGFTANLENASTNYTNGIDM